MLWIPYGWLISSTDYTYMEAIVSIMSSCSLRIWKCQLETNLILKSKGQCFIISTIRFANLTTCIRVAKTVVHKWQDGVLHAVIKVDVVYVNIVCVWKHLEEALDLATDKQLWVITSNVTWAWRICLICMPEAWVPQAQRLRAYISGKSRASMLQVLCITSTTFKINQIYCLLCLFK